MWEGGGLGGGGVMGHDPMLSKTFFVLSSSDL